MARTIQRCSKCRSEKGKTHKPFCGYRTTPGQDNIIYTTSVESGYTDSSSSDSSSSSDCGSGGGGE